MFKLGRQRFPTLCYWKKSPKVLGDEILNLQIVFIRTASCLRGQQSSLVVDHGRPGKKEEEETCTSRGLLALKCDGYRYLSKIWIEPETAAVCSLSIDAFRFQRHGRFRSSLVSEWICSDSEERAKRDEFLIHSADVMRSRSSRRRPTESRPYECHVFTEPGLKETIICPWRMGNLLCTGTRSLRLAINNNPATAQLPQNSSAMSSLVCVSKRGRKNGNSFWPSEGPPEPHISEGKSLSAFSKAPNVCETGSHTVLGLIGT
jgi:hypothetical protein